MAMKKNYDYLYALRKEAQIKIRNIILLTGSIILFLVLFFRFVTYPVVVQSISMEPNFSSRSFVFITPLTAASAKFPALFTVDRGDVALVSYEMPAKIPLHRRILEQVVAFCTFQQVSLNNARHNVTFSSALSRVAGMPGDTVYMKDHILYIKPQGETHFFTEFELSDKKYNIVVQSVPLDWDPSLGIAGEFSEIILGDNQFFFLCDNRSTSADSRLWGPVEGKRIAGKAWLRYLPLEKFAKF
jgi:signal peptidase I